MSTQLPVLYSFRRCPYAIRARMALHYADISVELREVVLKDKPPSMLAITKKATVPVLHRDNGQVLDESIDIMHWALAHKDVDQWWPNDSTQQIAIKKLIELNDFQFKPWLDRYKYFERHPEHDRHYYYRHACEFLDQLEDNLQAQRFLIADTIRLADIAIFPFIRQFVNADKCFFEQAPYPALKQWLDYFLALPSFSTVMEKYPQWHQDDPPVFFPKNPTLHE